MMTQTVRHFAAPQDDLTRLRRHAALVRSLLDELDRVLPPFGPGQRAGEAVVIHEQLVEELSRVGCRLLECAASLSEVVSLRRPVAGRA
jgi:hypothetical protein